MPTCYVLVGIPGSGKSTWASNQDLVKDFAYISTDGHVEDYAKSKNKTYSEVFDECIKQASVKMTEDVVKARKENKNIIWDQTSVSVTSRRKKFNILPGYKMIAVVFETPKPKELARRLASRPGKHIPDFVINSMINTCVIPTRDEGFDEVIFA